LDDSVKDLGQRYIAVEEIPRGKLLAVYFGSLERLRPGVMDSLNHSMTQGKLDLDYELFVDGTPREGDTRPGRFQLFNHCCEPRNNAVCEEWECRETGLIAYCLRSSDVIALGAEVRSSDSPTNNQRSKTEYRRILPTNFGRRRPTFHPLQKASVW
jgi:hypothetical protein